MRRLVRRRRPHPPRQDRPARARARRLGPESIEELTSRLSAARTSPRSSTALERTFEPQAEEQKRRKRDKSASPPADRRAARHQHDLGRRRRAPPRADGRRRPAQDDRRVHPGHQPRRPFARRASSAPSTTGRARATSPTTSASSTTTRPSTARRGALGHAVRPAGARPRPERAPRLADPRRRAARSIRTRPPRSSTARATSSSTRSRRSDAVPLRCRRTASSPVSSRTSSTLGSTPGSPAPSRRRKTGAPPRLPTEAGLRHRRPARRPGAGPWDRFTALNSLRDVEPTVGLILTDGALFPGAGSGVSETGWRVRRPSDRVSERFAPARSSTPSASAASSTCHASRRW